MALHKESLPEIFTLIKNVVSARKKGCVSRETQPFLRLKEIISL